LCVTGVQTCALPIYLCPRCLSSCLSSRMSAPAMILGVRTLKRIACAANGQSGLWLPAPSGFCRETRYLTNPAWERASARHITRTTILCLSGPQPFRFRKLCAKEQQPAVWVTCPGLKPGPTRNPSQDGVSRQKGLNLRGNKGRPHCYAFFMTTFRMTSAVHLTAVQSSFLIWSGLSASEAVFSRRMLDSMPQNPT
jgi:hypothetical protein